MAHDVCSDVLRSAKAVAAGRDLALEMRRLLSETNATNSINATNATNSTTGDRSGDQSATDAMTPDCYYLGNAATGNATNGNC